MLSRLFVLALLTIALPIHAQSIGDEAWCYHRETLNTFLWERSEHGRGIRTDPWLGSKA